MMRFSGVRKGFCILAAVMMLACMTGAADASAEKAAEPEWGILDTYSNLLGSSAAENADTAGVFLHSMQMKMN